MVILNPNNEVFDTKHSTQEFERVSDYEIHIMCNYVNI